MEATTRESISPRDAAVVWALAFATSSVLGTHGIAYWDAGDYTLLAINGGQSGLLLGRPVFLWISRIVLALGVDAAHAEPVLRWFWAAAGGLAAPALAVLAARLGLERRASLMAGVALALSPSFAHTSHQVLTDAPALALSIAALACAAARQPWRAGLLLAVAIATRETAAVHIVAAVLLLGVRRGLVCVAVCASALAGVITIAQPPGVMQWMTAMSQSAATHRLSAMDVAMSLVWVVVAGPMPVYAGCRALLNREVPDRVRFVAVPSVIATALLLFYPDGSFSPRYMLATVPLAFFLPGARLLSASRPGPKWVALFLLIPLMVAVVPAAMAGAVAARGAKLSVRIPALPQGAVVVPGHFCPQARLAANATSRSDLRFVCPGWDWPEDVFAELDSALQGGHPVAIDADDSAWVGRRELPARDAARAWLGARSTYEVAGFSVVSK